MKQKVLVLLLIATFGVCGFAQDDFADEFENAITETPETAEPVPDLETNDPMPEPVAEKTVEKPIKKPQKKLSKKIKKRPAKLSKKPRGKAKKSKRNNKKNKKT